LKVLLTAAVQSVIKRLPNSLFQPGRIHGRTYGHKGSLLNVKEAKYKKELGGAEVESGAQERELLFPRNF
jgi:hypothetical protein